MISQDGLTWDCQTQDQIEADNNIKFVVMPANTTVNVNQVMHNYLDTSKLQDEYMDKMSFLLSLPKASTNVSGESSKRSKTEALSSKPKNDDIKHLLSFVGNVSKICNEMQSMMLTIDTFCECTDVEALIEKFYSDSMERHKGIAKHRHSLQVQRNSYAIPLQLLKLGPSKSQCEITLSTEVCTVFFAPILYQESFLKCDGLLDFIMKTTNMRGLALQEDLQTQNPKTRSATNPSKIANSRVRTHASN